MFNPLWFLFRPWFFKMLHQEFYCYKCFFSSKSSLLNRIALKLVQTEVFLLKEAEMWRILLHFYKDFFYKNSRNIANTQCSAHSELEIFVFTCWKTSKKNLIQRNFSKCKNIFIGLLVVLSVAVNRNLQELAHTKSSLPLWKGGTAVTDCHLHVWQTYPFMSILSDDTTKKKLPLCKAVCDSIQSPPHKKCRVLSVSKCEIPKKSTLWFQLGDTIGTHKIFSSFVERWYSSNRLPPTRLTNLSFHVNSIKTIQLKTLPLCKAVCDSIQSPPHKKCRVLSMSQSLRYRKKALSGSN